MNESETIALIEHRAWLLDQVVLDFATKKDMFQIIGEIQYAEIVRVFCRLLIETTEKYPHVDEIAKKVTVVVEGGWLDRDMNIKELHFIKKEKDDDDYILKLQNTEKEKNDHEIYINDLCIREDGEDIIKDNRPLSLEIKNYRLNDDKNTRGVEKYINR